MTDLLTLVFRRYFSAAELALGTLAAVSFRDGELVRGSILTVMTIIARVVSGVADVWEKDDG